MLLDLIGEYPDDAYLGFLAARLGLAKPTCHRLLSSLENHGIVRREADKRYVFGPRIVRWAFLAEQSGSLRKLSEPVLRGLRDKSGLTTMLIVRDGTNTLCLSRIDGDHFVQTLTGRVGGSVPLGVGPSGVAILSCLPPKERARLIQGNVLRYGRFRNCAPDVIEQRCQAVVSEVAVDEGEIIPGIAGISCCLRDRNGLPIGALGFTFFAEEGTEQNISLWSEILRKAAKSIQKYISPNMIWTK